MSKKKNHMYWFMMFCIGLAIGTYILPMATLNVGARYFGMMLMPCASGKYTARRLLGRY